MYVILLRLDCDNEARFGTVGNGADDILIRKPWTFTIIKGYLNCDFFSLLVFGNSSLRSYWKGIIQWVPILFIVSKYGGQKH